MNIKYWMMLCFFGLLVLSCSQDPSKNYQELDLLTYGFPISVMAPDSPEVKTFDLIVKKDITIKSGEDYYVQIFMGDASIYDPKKIKDGLLNEIETTNEYFKSIIKDEEQGFIYETSIDSTTANYAFNYVKIQGDKEYIFQNGILGNFTLEQIERMYEAVKNEKQ